MTSCVTVQHLSVVPPLNKKGFLNRLILVLKLWTIKHTAARPIVAVNARRPLRHSTSGAAVTPTHASYPCHSSSAVLFWAAKMCRNTRSGAQRKDSSVAGGGPNEPVTPSHLRQPTSTRNGVDRSPVCLLLLTFPHLVNEPCCVLASVPSQHVAVISAMLHGFVVVLGSCVTFSMHRLFKTKLMEEINHDLWWDQGMLYLNMTQKCVTKEGDQQNLQPLTRVKEINQTTASASKRSLCVWGWNTQSSERHMRCQAGGTKCSTPELNLLRCAAFRSVSAPPVSCQQQPDKRKHSVLYMAIIQTTQV